jgi:hypothetical protein
MKLPRGPIPISAQVCKNTQWQVLCRRLGLGVKTWTCSMTENTIISLGYGGEYHYASVDLQVLHYKDSVVFIFKMYSKSSEVYSSLLLNPSILSSFQCDASLVRWPVL